LWLKRVAKEKNWTILTVFSAGIALIPSSSKNKKTRRKTMMEAIKTIEKDGYILKIFYDESPESPREWDNLGTLIFVNKPRSLGDYSDPGADIEAAKSALIRLPIYIYIHSGIAISTAPFSCHWDSGFLGYYYVTREKVISKYGEVTPENIQTAENRARAELEAFGIYLSGDVYGFTIEKAGEVIDSRWGYYGEGGIKGIEELFKETLAREYIKNNPLFAWAGITA
jgi:hypothetical protein